MKPQLYNHTPLMALGAWVRRNSADRMCRTRGSIVGCPWQVLDDAYRHLALRIRATEARAQNHRSRTTLRWLRRWRSLAEIELTDQRNRARAALRMNGPAGHRGSMSGLTHAYRDRQDYRFICGAVADAKLEVLPGSAVTCMRCLLHVARMAVWEPETLRAETSHKNKERHDHR